MSELSITPKTKLCVVVRKDLKLTQGKEDSQVIHAAMAFLSHRMMIEMSKGRLIGSLPLTDAETRWLTSGLQTVIALEVEDEPALFALAKEAQDAGLETHLMRDAGLTMFHGVPTFTCLALGPDFESRLNPVTKKLKLRK